MDIQEQLNQLDVKKCLGIGIVLATIYYVVVFDNGQRIENSISETRTKMTNQRASLNKVLQAIEDQKKFEAEIKNITKNMQDFQKYFVPPMTVNDLSEKVSNYAEASDLVINNLKPAKKSPEFNKYIETVVEFDIEGSFHNIMNFISLLTQMNRAIDFSQMKFTTVVDGDFPIIKLESTLVVYGSQEGDDEKAATTSTVGAPSNG